MDTISGMCVQGRCSLACDAGAVVDSVGGWVWDENVHRFLRHLARVVEYEFDALDWGAVEAGLAVTDDDRDLWFAYPLVGDSRVDVELARSPDSHAVMVRVSGETDAVMVGRIETLMSVFSENPRA